MNIIQSTTTRVERKVEITLTGDQIADLLNQELKASGADMRVPDNVEVTFLVPGGADWSNTSFDIDEDYPVRVSWTEVSEDQQ